MGQEKYYSMDQVLKELQIDTQELQRLISEGELTPQRDGSRFKFLENEVMDYKTRQMDNPTIYTHGNNDSNNDVEIIEQIAENEGELISANDSPIEDVQPLLSMDSDAKLEEQFQSLISEEQNNEIQEANVIEQGEVIQEELPGEILEEEQDIVKEMEDEHLHAADNPMDFAQGNVEDIVNSPIEVSADSIEEASDKIGIPNDQMLEISDQQEIDSSYLADLQNQVKESDTDELKFENADGDKFMETGEVLSESIKEKKLPADKDVEELFTDEHLDDDNENLKSQTHIKDEVDLNEEEPNWHDDQSVGLAKTKTDVMEAEPSSSKTTILVGVILFALLGGVGSSFVFWDPLALLGLSGKPVEVSSVSMATVQSSIEVAGQVSCVEFPITSPSAGKIQNLAAVGQGFESNSKIATLVQEDPAYLKLIEQKNNYEKIIAKANADIKAYSDFASKNKVVVDTVKNLSNPKTKATAEASLKKEPLKTGYANYLKLVTIWRSADASKKATEPKLKEVNLQISKLKTKTSEIAINTPDSGKIMEWKVKENDMILENAILATFQSNVHINVVIDLPKEDAGDYAEGKTITLWHPVAGQDLTFLVKKVESTDSIDTVSMVISNDASLLSKDTSDRYCFSYPKETSGIVVTKDLICSDGTADYVWVVVDNKIAKKNVGIRPVWKDAEKVIVEGLSDKDLLLLTKNPELVEGTKVKATIR